MSVMVGTATALYATWLSRKETDWKSAMVLIGFSILGVPVGIYALSYLPDSIMKMGLGIFLIVYSFYSLFVPRLPVYDKNWIAAPMGAVAGALGAAFSTNGPPVVIYGMLRNLGPAAFRGTLNAFLHCKQPNNHWWFGNKRYSDCRYSEASNVRYSDYDSWFCCWSVRS